MRGTVRMTAQSVRPSRTGVLGDGPGAPKSSVAPADARVECSRSVLLSLFVLDAYSRLRWGGGSERALHRLWADGGGGAVRHGDETKLRAFDDQVKHGAALYFSSSSGACVRTIRGQGGYRHSG